MVDEVGHEDPDDPDDPNDPDGYDGHDELNAPDDHAGPPGGKRSSSSGTRPASRRAGDREAHQAGRGHVRALLVHQTGRAHEDAGRRRRGR